MLKQELDFFIANQPTLASEYPGKVLVIKDQKVIGVYETELQAYVEAQKTNELGTFLIQPCESGAEAYTVTINYHEFFEV
jgi:hypothetical protein